MQSRTCRQRKRGPLLQCATVRVVLPRAWRIAIAPAMYRAAPRHGVCWARAQCAGYVVGPRAQMTLQLKSIDKARCLYQSEL